MFPVTIYLNERPIFFLYSIESSGQLTLSWSRFPHFLSVFADGVMLRWSMRWSGHGVSSVVCDWLAPYKNKKKISVKFRGNNHCGDQGFDAGNIYYLYYI